MVDGGKILPKSYQVMPSYRVISGENGPLVLSKSMHDRLMSLLNE
jgi:hypothetical protein